MCTERVLLSPAPLPDSVCRSADAIVVSSEVPSICDAAQPFAAPLSIAAFRSFPCTCSLTWLRAQRMPLSSRISHTAARVAFFGVGGDDLRRTTSLQM
ncbi:hypothetical protein MRX96_032770 [Rhipicephalus microplus]